MTPKRLDKLLKAIRSTRVAVLGDFCLDAYWMIDPALAERSVETGKTTRPVRHQTYSLGGAGNIVANLVDLGVRKVFALGVIGGDLFGAEIIRKLKALKVDAAGMVVQDKEWATPVYGKPYVDEDEEPRVDFGVYNRLSSDSENALEKALLAVLPRVQAVVFNQQLARGIASDAMIRKINRLVASRRKHIFVCDSRTRSERFKKVIYSFNAHEAARLCGCKQHPEQSVLLEDAVAFARRIRRMSGRPVFISRGERGSVVCWNGGLEIVPGIQILKKTDPVGAGDTSVSAIAGALAAGAAPREAAILANFASAVTVRKLRTTGTATPQEIRAIGYDPDYIYRPELAGDPRAARYVKGSEIEIVTGDRPRGRVRHALFDNDGTISTLRQGWEPIMEAMFVRSILGLSFAGANEALYRRVVACARDYITKSTGIQTMSQMSVLAELVREFGIVPADQTLSPLGYKRVYLKSLMETVRRRVAKLERGELDVSDFAIKGAVPFLQALRARGVRLYLASGTDDADVRREARALGYAGLFDGGIYGASNDAAYDAKREVIRRILASNRLSGAALACFGDGPVELREGKKRGGLAVGVASDEVRRYGLNPEKRSRLICAGADLIVPDFTQGPALLKLLT
ncbi:MAG: PfkB family carbohydrate kinase [Verrucomicrobiota bacterium]|nr:PfkB family carbohydrate kinase [Verrucomicrobiota bacterium]